MEFKGTKGEWISRSNNVFCNGKHVAICIKNQYFDNEGNIAQDVRQFYNAKLIAAAPDLLKALHELLETCPCDPDITTEFWEANQKAKQAIEKALK